MASCDVVVIGGGLAGAATAYHLTRLGVRDVAVLEREPLPGMHSSGRNAAMARETAVPDAIRPLAEEGVRFMAEPPEDLRTSSLLRACGLLLLAEGAAAARLASTGGCWIGRAEVVARVPLTRGGVFEGALFGARDGVVDIARLLDTLLAAAARGGARLVPGRRVTGIDVQRNRVVGVETTGGRISTPHVVNAAGAWASDVATMAGAAAVPLDPRRRHLFVSGPRGGIDPGAPIVWDVSHDFYLRPEAPGLLLSPCDETPHLPGLPADDPAAGALLAAKLTRFMPALADLPLARSWAGLRVLTPDGSFVLGRDPEIESFVWCAGLGGHGMTTSPAVGRIAAEAVLGRPTPPAHAPERFARTPLHAIRRHSPPSD